MNLLSKIGIITVLILFTSCNSNEIEQREIYWEKIEEDVATLSDGTKVDLWINDFGQYVYYRLDDETVLLRFESSGPDNSFMFGVDNLDSLSEIALANIISYYAEKAPLYDINNVLEKAYENYLNFKDEIYYTSTISYDVTPCSSNKKYISFSENTLIGEGSEKVEDINYKTGATFDKETGNKINIWDLFLLPEDESKKALIDIAKIAEIDNTDVALEMMEAIESDNIVFSSDILEIYFDKEVLPSLEMDNIVAIKYSDLKGVLKEEAFPVKNIE